MRLITRLNWVSFNCGILLLFSTLNAQYSPLFQSAILNSNEIRATISNDGSLFWNDDMGQFFAPYTGYNSVRTMYYAGLQVASRFSNGNVFVTYPSSKSDYKPGPLYNSSFIPDDSHYNKFNKIWMTDYTDIIAHQLDFTKDGKIDVKRSSIYSWPGKSNPYFEQFNGFKIEVADYSLAPFYDNNQDGIYNPDQGDYPWHPSLDHAVVPQQLFWTIFSNTNIYLRLEIGLTAWAFNCTSNPILNRSIFCSYQLTNKDVGQRDLIDCRMGINVDPEIGCYNDDYVGSYPDGNASYWYNADSIDGDSLGNCPGPSGGFENMYKNSPPVQSIVFLNRPMDVFNLYFNPNHFNVPTELMDPANNKEHYNYFKGLNRLGYPIINPISGDLSKHVFSDNPNTVNGWSMYQKKLPYFDNEVRIFNVAECGDVAYNESQTLDLAFVFHHSPDSNHLQNVNLAYQQIEQVHQIYNDHFVHSCMDQKCVSDCVWTADTDNNGRVEYLDAINIFRGYGSQGPQRDHVYEWNGQSVTDWNQRFVNQLNYKFADVNGDGSVDSLDLYQLRPNNYFTHDNPAPLKSECIDGNDLVWQWKNVDSLYKGFDGSKIVFTPPINRFEGLSYEIEYDSKKLQMSIFSSNLYWEDTLVKNNYHRAYVQDKYTGKSFIQEVIMNKNKTNEIAKKQMTWSVTFQKLLELDPKIEYADIKICNAKLYTVEGSIIPLSSKILRIYFKKKTGNLDAKSNTFSFEMYPNPVSSKLYVESLSEHFQVSIFNAQGVLVRQYYYSNSKNEINISALSNGIYFIKIEDDYHSQVQKLIISR